MAARGAESRAGGGVREVILDTETTGLDPLRGDRITEIGCIEVVDCVPTGRSFHSYVNPEREVPSEIIEITGVTTAFLADKPVFREILEPLLAFVGSARLVAHNAPFDRSFVNAELARQKRSAFPDDRWIDTAELARAKFPGAQTSLDALCRRFGVSLERRVKHGALIDAELLAEVYLQLNGGRERKLDFGEAATAAVRAAAREIRRAARPVPLGSLLTTEEAQAHAAFVATLGQGALWLKYN
jgi:DNA polymerase-3 subunit epsilon